jgi:hypothetical protein
MPRKPKAAPKESAALLREQRDRVRRDLEITRVARQLQTDNQRLRLAFAGLRTDLDEARKQRDQLQTVCNTLVRLTVVQTLEVLLKPKEGEKAE